MCKNQNRFLLTSVLLPSISLVVGQSLVNIPLEPWTRDTSTSGLTCNSDILGKKSLSKNLFLNQILPIALKGNDFLP